MSSGDIVPSRTELEPTLHYAYQGSAAYCNYEDVPHGIIVDCIPSDFPHSFQMMIAGDRSVVKYQLARLTTQITMKEFFDYVYASMQEREGEWQIFYGKMGGAPINELETITPEEFRQLDPDEYYEFYVRNGESSCGFYLADGDLTNENELYVDGFELPTQGFTKGILRLCGVDDPSIAQLVADMETIFNKMPAISMPSQAQLKRWVEDLLKGQVEVSGFMLPQLEAPNPEDCR